MPKLIDMAFVTVGKTRTADTQKALIEYSNRLQKPLSLKNKMKVQLTVGDESKLVSIKGFEDSNGIFASWCKELERVPKTDIYEFQPLNKVKTTDKEDIRNLDLEIKHKEWLKEVNERMEKLGFRK